MGLTPHVSQVEPREGAPRVATTQSRLLRPWVGPPVVEQHVLASSDGPTAALTVTARGSETLKSR